MSHPRTREQICSDIFTAIVVKGEGPFYFGDITYDELLRLVAPDIGCCPMCGAEMGVNIDCKACEAWTEIMARIECEEGPNPALANAIQAFDNGDVSSLLHTTLQALGEEHQMRKFQEECSEASAAVNRFIMGRDDGADALASELADVLLTSASMRLIFNQLKPGLVEKKLGERLQRLRERVDAYLAGKGPKP
jgi:post-segregation antitoxin (ccd killing protein)